MGVTVSSGDSNGLRKFVWDRWQECARRLTTPLIKKLNIQVLPIGANFDFYVAGPTLKRGANLLAPRRIRLRRASFFLALLFLRDSGYLVGSLLDCKVPARPQANTVAFTYEIFFLWAAVSGKAKQTLQSQGFRPRLVPEVEKSQLIPEKKEICMENRQQSYWMSYTSKDLLDKTLTQNTKRQKAQPPNIQLFNQGCCHELMIVSSRNATHSAHAKASVTVFLTYQKESGRCASAHAWL